MGTTRPGGVFALIGVALLLSSAALAQVEFRGNLYVTVKDEAGAAVTGAEAKLTGADYARIQTTDAEGKVRFTRLNPGGYELQVSARGYNTTILQGIRIETLANPEMFVTIAKSTTEERVVVTAETPLLDRRDTGTSTVLTQAEITQIPTARDPWAVLSTIPGITTDRVNVGGNEAGQQSVYVGKGDNGTMSTWVMDGVEFTDNAAKGATSTYLDFNSFEEIGFVSGGADVDQSTPGLRLNFVTKQGSNRHTGTMRMLFADADLQDDVPAPRNPDWVIAANDGGNQFYQGDGINEVFEKNFDIGGPILKDKLWYWGGYTQNDIDFAKAGQSDKTKLQNLGLKVHGQANGGQTNYKAFYSMGDKIKTGRGASTTRPPETTWDQSGPSPIYSASIDQFFGPDLELSLLWGKVEGGFQLIPEGGLDTQIHLDYLGVWQNTYFQYVIDRPTEHWTARANWYKDIGDWSHELKFGFRYKETTRETSSTYAGGVVSWAGEDGFNSSVNLYRDGVLRDQTKHTNVWAGDTMIKGPWAINAGFNWSTQKAKQLPSSVPANPLIPDTLPGLSTRGYDPGIKWDDIMPRVGVTYTFDTAKRLMLKASYGQYVDTLSNVEASYNNPVGPSYLAYYWNQQGPDDYLVDPSEIDFASGLISWGNINPDAPTELLFVNAVQPDLEAPKVNEFIVGAEYELAKNFTVGAALTWRKRDRVLWTPLFNEAAWDQVTGRFTDPSMQIYGSNYYDCVSNGASGTFPGSGAAYSEPLCTLNDTGAALSPTRGTMLANRPGYNQEFRGLELTVNKRLSGHWMLRGYLAYNDWKQHFSGEPTSSYWEDGDNWWWASGIDGDPTNSVGGKADDGGLVAVQSGGSGSYGEVWLGTAKWQYNVNALYELPRGFSVSGNLQGRQGYGIPYYHFVQTVDYDGFQQTKHVQIGSVADERYKNLTMLDLKFGKAFHLDGGTLVDLGLEGFNVFNADTVMQLGREVNDDAQYNEIRQVLSPRILRLSATITF